MSNKTKNILLIVLSALLVAIVAIDIAAYRTNKKHSNEKVITTHTTDTLIIERIDTTTITEVVERTRRVVDTLVLHDTIRLFVIQKHYAQEGAYDAWISGVEPLSLDSIRVYNRTVTETIHHHTTNTITRNPWRMYADISAMCVNQREVIPTIGLRVETPKKVAFGAYVGYYDKNVAYGFTLGYKILEK